MVRDEILRTSHYPGEVADAQLPGFARLAQRVCQRQTRGIRERPRALRGIEGFIFGQQSRAYGLRARGVYADQVAAVFRHALIPMSVDTLYRA
jgi:hypothetical protein